MTEAMIYLAMLTAFICMGFVLLSYSLGTMKASPKLVPVKVVRSPRRLKKGA